MTNADGSPKLENFAADRLHLVSTGYDTSAAVPLTIFQNLPRVNEREK